MCLSLQEPPCRLEGAECSCDAAPAEEVSDALRLARTNIAAATARLPITPEMAWAVPQLLKRAQLIAPGAQTTTGVLRAVIRMPECDEQFAAAFADSGFLSCAQVLEQAHWKYDIAEMIAFEHSGGAIQVQEHCRRTVAALGPGSQQLDWDDALDELRVLAEWFPQLRTVALLRQLYARLHVLHTKAVLVAHAWLELRQYPERGARRA